MNVDLNIDWMACELVERVPGKMSGQPVIKGTRVSPETIVANFEGGSPLEEIQENYPHVPMDTIQRIIAFHQAHDPQMTL